MRTEREFAAGHPQGAVNIPVAFPDPARGMVMNADFVKVVEGNFPKDRKIIVGCQAGPRSNAAAGLLQQAGYQDVLKYGRRFRRNARSYGQGDRAGLVESEFARRSGQWRRRELPVTFSEGSLKVNCRFQISNCRSQESIGAADF